MQELVQTLKKHKKELVCIHIDEIIPYEQNNKVHTEQSVDGLEVSMQKAWYIAPIIVDEANQIIAWHGRLLSLKRFQETEIDVIRVYGMSEKEKRYYRISDNTTNHLAWYDKDNLLKELEFLWEFALDIPDHLPFDLNFSFFNEESFDEAREDEVPILDETDIIVKKWDIFTLWSHRLMCGDSSESKDVQTLMNGELADMVFTDPPYNVNYKGQGKNTKRGIENDHMEDQAFYEMLILWFQRYREITKEKSGIYVFHSSSTQNQFERALRSSWFEIKNQLIWNKPSAALGWWDYRWKHEPFFYCTQKWKSANFYWDRTHWTVISTLEWKTEKQLLNILKRAKEAEKEGKTTIWSMRRANVGDYVHPTQKPVELIEYALNNSSKPYQNIVDLFWGSWSTLIACEKKKRKSFIMELEPYFVQTILKRFYDITQWKIEVKCVNREINLTFLS